MKDQDNETVYDVLRSMWILRNVGSFNDELSGFTEKDWADFVNQLQDYFGDDQ